jgi:predicted component of type VI protein secretion system
MTIGRKEDNDIRIENLAVSGHHAKLLTIFDDSFLEDLNSTNGTFVNGQRITKHPLRSGDVITIGKHELRYLNKNSAAIEDDGEKTVLIRPKATATPPTYPSSVAASSHEVEYEPVKVERSPLETAKLQILNGSGAGKELPLRKASVKLGKAGSEVVQINKRPDGHFIVCLDHDSGKTPPRVNGEDIGARARKLENHDVIEINRLKIEYYLAS